jgi:phosphinothricin acetyltransferase
MSFTARPARAADAEAIARIYNEGIEDRLATFETRPRSAADVVRWVEDGFPLVVVEEDGTVLAWASAAPYRPGREAYAGIGDFSVYVGRAERGRGAGRAAMEALEAEARRRGFWKLVSRSSPRTRRAWGSAGPSASARSASTAAMPCSTASGATWSWSSSCW